MDVLSISLGVSTALGSAATAFLYWETRGSRARAKRDDAARALIAAAVAPVENDLRSLEIRLDSDNSHLATTIKIALAEALEPVRDQISTLNTKMEPLWEALINMGINQTKVLHQPDPRRAEIDCLLEGLQEEFDGGRLLTVSEVTRLRAFLTKIKTWEPGQDVGFPVLPGEPTSAATLLAIMGLARQRREQGQVPG